jgi:hypothetical protein
MNSPVTHHKIKLFQSCFRMIRHVESSETVLAVLAYQRVAALATAVDGMWGEATVSATSVLTPPTTPETDCFVS